MTRLTILTLTLLSHFSYGQTLNLDDIINVRTMDSIELRTFCSERGFKIKEKKEDNWIYSHSYFSQTDNSIWFLRTFPKDTTGNKFVYYYYADNKTQGEFKRQMKDKGFKFKRTDTKDYRGNKFTHNIYLTKDSEIDLASDKLIGQKTKYTLLHYRRVN
jgi:hypothetical protein